MGDPVSVASDVVALSTFALQASKSLYQTIKDFRNSKRATRELRNEVQALSQTLEVLKHVAAEYEVELLILKLPLLRCGAACKELSDRIDQYVKHSEGSKTSLRDWTRLQYMGEDITNYKNVIANYKETIYIALGGATFQSAVVTHQVLQEYTDMIQNTTSDLQDQLDEIEGKLSTSQSLDDPDATISHEELQRLEDEKQSTTQCLDVCKQVSDYIDQSQSKREHKTGKATGTHDTTSQENSNPNIAQQIAQKYMKSSKQNISPASNRHKDRLDQLEANLQSSKNSTLPDQVACDIQKTKDQRETVAGCVNICADAYNLSESFRVNIFEDVASLDDSQQVLVSTTGNLLNAKRISTGARSLQVLGQMSDETLQHLNFQQNGSAENGVVGVEQKEGKDFHNRYGTGRSIRNENPARKPGSFRSTP
ncbi:hypothetical protein BDW74DRAFT_104527 [Aspergillus multicolor]|uniref:uncharacterized protein n=1 Tax=Aspergillus multicolor TaxID=41759 RepID=UPI003CCD75E7